MPINPLFAAQAGIGAIQTIAGLFSAKKRRKEADDAFNSIETYKQSAEVQNYYDINKLRASQGLSAPETQQYLSNVESGANASLYASQDRRGGLASIGTTNAQRQKGYLGLASLGEQARQQNIGRLGTATNMQSAEETKAFKSRQEKQVLKYQQTLARMASNRASIAQGLGALGSGLANQAISGGLVGVGASPSFNTLSVPFSGNIGNTDNLEPTGYTPSPIQGYDRNFAGSNSYNPRGGLGGYFNIF